ncbi:MAG: L-aspartate oxidase, partial [Azoarcus sp.]|nr:L-aspartate oxidase [Azoarcus sp.]
MDVLARAILPAFLFRLAAVAHPNYQYDVLILGSGAAGQSIALLLADHLRVALVTKRELATSASALAQGGIAAVLDTADSVEAHIRDTFTAGAGLCDPAVTRFVVEHSREAIAWLIERGVPFTREDDSELGFHLTREGGHSHRRIIHAADATGAAVQTTLSEAVLAHPNIDIYEHHIAIDLILGERVGQPALGCVGAYALDIQNGHVVTFSARSTVLATGGTGKVYLFTTNPDVATGDGVAMAWRAGCRVRNMEFIQFHPTCLYHPQAKSFLISEAVRGEGGLLKLPDGSRFMPAHDERAELAPRDIVARAIDFEMKKHGLDCVYLDISHKPADWLREHFPNIHARCLELGIDITREPIPVVPAAHYSCGGIVTDLAARTDVPNLYAVGESAGTGLHGANRLASNSLLECLVFGEAAARDILSRPSPPIPPLPAWDDSQVTNADEEVVLAHNWAELRQAMWDYVGIVRT